MTNWLNRLAFISLLGFPIAVICVRLGLFNFRVGLLLVLASLLIALFVIIIGVFLYFKNRNVSRQKSKGIRNAILISSIPLIGIGAVFFGARGLPQIHNISTDTADPPSFVKIHQLRTEDHNPLEYKTDELAAQQLAAYPNIKTLTVAMSKAEAHERAVQVIEQLGWQIVDENFQLGLIEASETTLLWGFTDDVVIRLRNNSSDDQVNIDLRSVSRVGMSDLGANAKRIEEFLSVF